MFFFKKIEVWKTTNIIVFFVLASILSYMYIYYDSWCQNQDIYCFYRFYDAIYNPVYFGGKILVIILGLLIFFPSRIFKKWLLFIAIPIITLTVYIVQDISVFSDNFLNPTRAQMSEIGMIFLAVITIIFVVAHLIYDWWKKKNSVKK